MGYRPPSTGTDLDFTGTQYEGLQVRVDSAPLGALLDVTEMAMSVQAGDGTRLRELFALFGGLMESWNVEDKKGKAVPATYEGLLTQDSVFVTAVMNAWMTNVAQASPDLGKGSPSGGSSAEGPAAMAALSSSPRSSSPQRLLSGCATAGTSCRARCSRSPPG